LSKITPIKSTVFLKLDKALQDEIITEGGIKFYLSPEYNPEWNATVTGKIKNLPKLVEQKNKHILSQLNIEDEVCFSYSVVADRKFGSTGALFQQVTEDNPYRKEFKNGVGEKIMAVAVNGKISKIWIGTYHDKYGQFVHGFQGTENQLEKWLSQFQFGKNQKMTYKNLLSYQAESFWKVDFANIFAKKKGKNIVALGDRVICKPVEKEVSREFLKLNGIDIPASSVKLRYYDRATVVSGGEKIGLKKGDVISFEERFLEKYNIWQQEFFVIKERRIQGKWC